MELFYRKIGKGEPLFILHGLFGSGDNWQSLAKRFSENFEVYVIDQRNHGQSFHSSDWNYDFMVDDLIEIIRQNSLSKINLIGHSMGGKTAMQFALSYPELVQNLVVVDISAKYYPVHHRQILNALLSLDLNKIKSRKEAESELAKSIQNIGELQFLLKNLYWKDVQNNQLAWRFNLDVINSKIEEVGREQSTGNYTGPSLFIRGELSNYVLNADQEMHSKLFPSSHLETIQGAGHWVQAEKPEAFFQVANQFLLSK